ncbi:MAG: hypothetical protein BWX54_02312 [Verrucomicrobia bacterium ADurb.Bin018]|nr:MAG: hypothetical protein BWX54_02312 [Verrucomicrobia bacterium ADurb.Bin018]
MESRLSMACSISARVSFSCALKVKVAEMPGALIMVRPVSSE